MIRLNLLAFLLFCLGLAPQQHVTATPIPAPPVAAIRAVPFTGPGIDTHGELCPTDALRAIGIRWIRASLAPQYFSAAKVKRVIQHYKGFPILWTQPQWSPHALEDLRVLAACGIADVELGNEPEEAQFSPDGQSWTPERYWSWFVKLQAVAPKTLRLYGPANGHYMPEWIAAKPAAARPYALTGHLYWLKVEDQASVYQECLQRWRLTFVNSETAYGAFPTVATYPEKRDPILGYLTAKDLLRSRAWCYYDIFVLFRSIDGGGTYTVPTEAYGTIARATTVQTLARD